MCCIFIFHYFIKRKSKYQNTVCRTIYSHKNQQIISLKNTAPTISPTKTSPNPSNHQKTHPNHQQLLHLHVLIESTQRACPTYITLCILIYNTHQMPVAYPLSVLWSNHIFLLMFPSYLLQLTLYPLHTLMHPLL